MSKKTRNVDSPEEKFQYWRLRVLKRHQDIFRYMTNELKDLVQMMTHLNVPESEVDAFLKEVYGAYDKIGSKIIELKFVSEEKV